MATYTEPATFIVAITGELSGPNGVRAAGPFPSFDLAQRFINECVQPEHEDSLPMVVALESPAHPSTFVGEDF
jgi:hypothetical protein